MKSILMILIMALLCFCALAANWEWVFSGGAGDLDRAWDMALDTQGNIFLTGEFVDTLQVGNIVVTGSGLTDIFVAKFNSSGTPLWAKAFGGSEGDIGIGIATDAAGNCYVTGLYAGTAQFEDESFSSAGSWDIFVLKLDGNGNKIWAHSIGGIEGDVGYGIAAMPDGRCFVTGWFGDTIHFQDNSTLTSFGGSDVLLFACAADGSLLWKRHAGDVGVEYGYKIDVDYYGNSYVTGVAGAGSDFSGFLLPGSGAFIVSYDLSGNIRWLNHATNAGVNSIAVDRSASVIEQLGCITGRVTGSASFGTEVLNSFEGSADAYEATFQLLTGQWISAVIGGGPGTDRGGACTYNNHPYYTGRFEDTASLFGYDVTSGGAADIYVHSAGWGLENWFLTAGGINEDAASDLAADDAGNVYICGWYSGLARFGPTLSIHSGNDSDLDFFLAKINTSTSAEDLTTPAAIGIINCYPNPFHAKMTVRIDLTDTASDKAQALDIYNVKGARVNRLPLTRLDGDAVSADWDGTGSNGTKCPVGVYFLRVANSSGKAKKVVLLK